MDAWHSGVRHDGSMTTLSAPLQGLLEREPAPLAPLRSTEVRYEHDGVPLAGHLVAPSGPGPFPGVLVVHDWYGVGDYVRVRCELLARLGYVALAADIYGDGVRLRRPPRSGPRGPGRRPPGGCVVRGGVEGGGPGPAAGAPPRAGGPRG